METAASSTHANGAVKAHTTIAIPVDKAQEAIEAIDKRIKSEYLDELSRAVLVSNREALYNVAGYPTKHFTKDTAEKTGISRAVIQRLRRIGHMPPEIRNVLTGTSVANRQDVLVQLSDRVEEAATPEERLQLAKDLIANPPTHGPRKKAPPAPIMPLPRQQTSSAEPGTIPFTFEGDRLDVVRLEDGDVGVTLRRLCEIVGVNPDSQFKRLNRTRALGARWASTVTMTVQVGDQGRPTTILPRRAIPMWAATLDASRCAPEALPKLIAFQDRAAEALAAAFLPNTGSLGTRFDRAIDRALDVINKRLDAIERGGALGTRGFLLIPQIDPEHAGFSMEAMNKSLADKGYSISPNDTAIRSIAAKLRIIGDPDFGFWNSHNDSIQLAGRPLSDSWRFSELGVSAIQPFIEQYCELKMKYEAASQPAPRDKALSEVLDGVTAIGNGTYENLTRTRGPRRQPFPAVRGPQTAG